MHYMAKPHVVRMRKRVELKSGSKVYEFWALRITAYDKEIKAVRQVHLRGLGAKPLLSESQAAEIVQEFGDKYGFSLEDLRNVRRLRVVPDEELATIANGGERDSTGKN